MWPLKAQSIGGRVCPLPTLSRVTGAAGARDALAAVRPLRRSKFNGRVRRAAPAAHSVPETPRKCACGGAADAKGAPQRPPRARKRARTLRTPATAPAPRPPPHAQAARFPSCAAPRRRRRRRRRAARGGCPGDRAGTCSGPRRRRSWSRCGARTSGDSHGGAGRRVRGERAVGP